MKTGDTVVCIVSGSFIDSNGIDRGEQMMISDGEHYTVSERISKNEVRLKGLGNHYNVDRFVTLSKYRQMKINKIKFNMP